LTTAALASDDLDDLSRLLDLIEPVLAEDELEPLRARIADAFAQLIGYESVRIYEASEDSQPVLVPRLVRHPRFAEAIVRSVVRLGNGLTGWAAQHRQVLHVARAHLDPRAEHLRDTPDGGTPEAMLVIPLIARDQLVGVLDLERYGGSAFSRSELALARRFAPLAAGALRAASRRASLERLALTDELTNLPNRRCLERVLEGEVARAERHHESLSLAVLDLDSFKPVNDRYGHAAGDRLLREIGSALGARLRGGDFAARVGGDEFVVILPSTDTYGAWVAAGELERAIAHATISVDGVDIAVSASVGIATRQDDETAVELLGRADRLMYLSKRRRRDTEA
jgi:diguanylate cyclase (GGDEF)-like protein